MAGIIKAGTLQNSPKAVVGTPYFHLQDFEQKAEKYVAEIQEEASGIITDARKEADSIREEIQVEARQQAVEKVRAEFDVQQKSHLAAIEPLIHTAVEQLQGELIAWRQQWERKTVDLAVAIAKKVVVRQIEDQPEIVLDQIQKALSLSGNQDEIRVHVHPQDHENLGQAIDVLLNNFGLLTKSTVVPDSLVGQGGCVIRTQHGMIDAQIETQLERIAEELA